MTEATLPPAAATDAELLTMARAAADRREREIGWLTQTPRRRALSTVLSAALAIAGTAVWIWGAAAAHAPAHSVAAAGGAMAAAIGGFLFLGVVPDGIFEWISRFNRGAERSLTRLARRLSYLCAAVAGAIAVAAIGGSGALLIISAAAVGASVTLGVLVARAGSPLLSAWDPRAAVADHRRARSALAFALMVGLAVGILAIYRMGWESTVPVAAAVSLLTALAVWGGAQRSRSLDAAGELAAQLQASYLAARDGGPGLAEALLTLQAGCAMTTGAGLIGRPQPCADLAIQAAVCVLAHRLARTPAHEAPICRRLQHEVRDRSDAELRELCADFCWELRTYLLAGF